MQSPVPGASPASPPQSAPRPGAPAFVVPALPLGASRDEWRDWTSELRARATDFRDQRAAWRDQIRDYRDDARDARRGRDPRAIVLGFGDHPERPMEERIASFRRRAVGRLSTIGFLFVINMVTAPEIWWWTIPGVFIGFGILRRWTTLWSDGATLKQLFRRGSVAASGPSADAGRALHQPPSAPARPALAATVDPPMVSDAVLAGPHGAAVRRANGDRIVIRELLASLSKTEREMLPDIGPTVTALSERIGSLASTLHSLDADASGANLGALDRRIADLKQERETPERDRRLSLLERQRSTVHDLLERRSRLLPRFESACGAMQNLKLDLLKLRSAGIDSALGDVTSATQEARALSRDIGHVLEAADEVRRL
jgi:serine/threonine-protein kinase